MSLECDVGKSHRLSTRLSSNVAIDLNKFPMIRKRVTSPVSSAAAALQHTMGYATLFRITTLSVLTVATATKAGGIISRIVPDIKHTQV